MRSLRILTMNIQAQAWPAGPHSDAERRAQALVDALNPVNFAFDEHPDVVVLNEADNEDAKEILERGLREMYPHYVVSFSGGSADLNDGGLAVFSKFEFMVLPDSDHNADDNKSRFYPYRTYFTGGGLFKMSAGNDGLAEKGVAIVQVSTGMQFEVVTIALTHMQAFYDEPGQHHEIRLRQLKFIEMGLIELLGEPEGNPAWDKVIVMGDLNIRGDKPPYSTEGYGEWTNVFLKNGGPYNTAAHGILMRQNTLVFTENLVDGWRTFMAPPGAIMEADPGLTNTNLVAGDNLPALLKERLDYMCFPKERSGFPGEIILRLVPQHLRILPMNFSGLDMAFEKIQSDHKGILAQVHWHFRYNTPNGAKVQLDFLEFQAPDSLVKVNIANDLELPAPGTCQWIYIHEPGTYTFNYSQDMEVSFYYEDNISTEIPPYNRLKAGRLGLDEIWLSNLWQEFGLADIGDQVDVHKPMFIKINAPASNPDFTGRVAFSFIKHTGENRYLAIGLRPNDAPKNPHLPVGQKNGKKDECWFRAPLSENLLSGAPYMVQFYIKNDLKKKIRFSLFESIKAQTAYYKTTSTAKKVATDYNRVEPITELYILLKRTNYNDFEFLAGYTYEISYLNHLEIYCQEDQSGLGADEIHLTMSADFMETNFLDFTDEDFDDEERRMLNSYYPKNVAFDDKLNITMYELDNGDDDDGPFTGEIPALIIGEEVRESSVLISAEGAVYQIIYKLSRLPNI